MKRDIEKDSVFLDNQKYVNMYKVTILYIAFWLRRIDLINTQIINSAFGILLQLGIMFAFIFLNIFI